MDSEFSRKKLLVFGTLFLVVLAIPITVYTALQQKDTRTKAAVSPEDTVIMAINGQQITKADIRKVAEEQNDSSAVDQQALLDAKELLEERKILDVAADNYNLTPDPDRVDRFKQDGLSDAEAKYEALKQQVTLKAVNSSEALSIGFWNPPTSGRVALSAAEQTVATSQLAAGVPALDEIETRMKAGEDTLEIADSILESNPELSSVLAVNGFIFDLLTGISRAQASYPIIYEWGDTSLDDETRNAVFALSQNSVDKTINTTDNRAGSVFRIVNKGNQNGSSTYDAWLTEQKATLVRDIAPL